MEGASSCISVLAHPLTSEIRVGKASTRRKTPVKGDALASSCTHLALHQTPRELDPRELSHHQHGDYSEEDRFHCGQVGGHPRHCS